MSSLKTLAFAGAVAVVATSAALSSSAVAADLMPPPMIAPPPPPMAGGSGGLYLRGDIGVGTLSADDLDLRLNGQAVAAGSLGYTSVNKKSSSGDSAFFVGAGIGYQFNSFLRFDATIERRSGTLHGSDALSYVNGGITTNQTNNHSVNMTSYVGLLNGYIDLGTWNCLTPYVGAGIGFANNRFANYTDNGIQQVGAGAPGTSFAYAAPASKTNLAWALMAGVAYDVNPNLKLELGYRYLNMGDGPVMALAGANGVLANPSYSVGYKTIDSHDLKIGMRWMFNDPNCCGPSAPQMASAPLIRKY